MGADHRFEPSKNLSDRQPRLMAYYGKRYRLGVVAREMRK